jgi:CBS domain-containing protein
MIAADIMQKDLVTIRDNATLTDLAKLLTEKRITGVPVVDERGALVGVVSQTDLVRGLREQGTVLEAPDYHQDLDRWLGRQGFQVEQPDYRFVREVMTPTVFSAEVDTPVEDLAKKMSMERIHRIVITLDGAPAGIVTTMDIMGVVAGRRPRRARA